MGAWSAGRRSHSGYRCFVHEHRHAVAACRGCGRSLCGECASHYRPAHCHECTVWETGRTALSQAARVVSTLAFAAAAAWLVSRNQMAGVRDSALFGVAAAFGLYGWAVVSRFFPKFYGPWPFLLVLLYLRIVASLAAGLIVGPYRVGQALWNIGSALRLRGSAKRILAT